MSGFPFRSRCRGIGIALTRARRLGFGALDGGGMRGGFRPGSWGFGPRERLVSEFGCDLPCCFRSTTVSLRGGTIVFGAEEGVQR